MRPGSCGGVHIFEVFARSIALRVGGRDVRSGADIGKCVFRGVLGCKDGFVFPVLAFCASCRSGAGKPFFCGRFVGQNHAGRRFPGHELQCPFVQPRPVDGR